jgi:two-component sensor histidine kinase
MSTDPEAGEAGSPILQGLRFRVAALLALSLLPIGIVTMLQTRELATEVESRSELTLLNLTGWATFGERQVTERALGAAEALSDVLRPLRSDPETCRDYLADYVESSAQFSFVGFIPPDGIVRCSSESGVLDFSGDPRLPERVARPATYIERIEEPGVSAEPVINIMRPVTAQGDAFIGWVSVSVPVRFAQQRSDMAAAQAAPPLSLVTFNREGQVLFEEVGARGASGPFMPATLTLTNLVGSDPHTFRAEDRTGQPRVFAIVPIIPDLVYALAAWPDQIPASRLGGLLSPTLLPLLMFAASISVAYFAVDRLVVRHVADLRRTMRAFARQRTLPSARRRVALSTELRELEEGFVDMAIDLANDEARMEDALREKNVLLKEIHHRVKNNLQLISSIMNMQIRAAREEETVAFLRRLQERVLGLAAVHRNLYQANDLSRTDAGRLLDDLFRQLVSMSPRSAEEVQFRGEFEQLTLYPDQALPLSLLASELGTNALNHVSAPEGRPKTITATLRQLPSGEAELACENSIGPDSQPANAAPGQGLGTRLIRAFAAQLGGTVETETTDDMHRVSLRFRVEAFSHAPGDY